jgi:hypothetical protein
MSYMRARSAFPLSSLNMSTVVRANLQRLKLPTGSPGPVTAVARANMRNFKLPPGSWDSHVHVVDEVSKTSVQGRCVSLTSDQGPLSIL